MFAKNCCIFDANPLEAAASNRLPAADDACLANADGNNGERLPMPLLALVPLPKKDPMPELVESGQSSPDVDSVLVIVAGLMSGLSGGIWKHQRNRICIYKLAYRPVT